MSHSQFHSTNLFILRHAWLNLWDKHMTTGRINQVTISVCNRRLTLPRKKEQTPHYSTSTGILRRFPQWAFVTRLQTMPLWIPPQSQSSIPFKERTKRICDQRKKHLVPRSHTIPRPALPVQRTKITAFSEDYQQPAHLKSCAQSRRIFVLVNWNRCNQR